MFHQNVEPISGVLQWEYGGLGIKIKKERRIKF